MKPWHFILVHGYTGTPEDLLPLQAALEAIHGPGCATRVALHPDWRGGAPPPFDTEALSAPLRMALADHPGAVLIAHSTGGTLALGILDGQETPETQEAPDARDAAQPALLVLAATPPRVDGSHLARLEAATRPGNAAPGLLDLSRMVRAINAAGSRPLPGQSPVLILQGEDDALVPVEDLRHWVDGPRTRKLVIPGADHDLLSGAPLGAVLEALTDALLPVPEAAPGDWARLEDLEPAVAAFAGRTPEGRRALLRSPGAWRALGGGLALPPDLGPLAPAPVIANVEVTTRCPHACLACARTKQPQAAADLEPARLAGLLARLPHASRLSFVGLGEPTLHPALPELVAQASRQGRSVALVTSGATLTPGLAARLADAGLGAITFSLDAAEPGLAERLRPGVPFRRTLAALEAAAELLRDRVPISVFTALCVDNAHALDGIADLALALGARAWMLSDLNFAANAPRSLLNGGGEAGREAVRRSVARALEAGLPALAVQGLEELGKPRRLRELLLRPADRLWDRSGRHRHCLSPWQTAPISAQGTLTACDCQPEVVVGNIYEVPFQALWNGPVMRALRRELLEGRPRPACLACPRL